MARSQSRFSKHWLSLPVVIRFIIAALFGAAAVYAIGAKASWIYTPLVFWDVTAFIASVALWLSVHKLDAEHTKAHATVADPSRGIVDAVLIFASVASLAGVFVLAIEAKHVHGAQQALDIGLGIVSVVVSWALVHLTHMLRYADLYFKGNGAINFNSDEPPTYQDFAYVAFTIGMTYQVSDTNLKTAEIRTVARQHAVISYIFGTAIIATVVNTIAGLGR